MQVLLSAALSHLYCMLGDMYMSTDTVLVQNFSLVF